MEDSKRVWVWVGVAVVVVAIVAWAVWQFTPKKQQQPASPVVTFAPQGQLIPQFPKELILDGAAAVSGSYSINYSTSTNQYTAEYDSSSSLVTLYNDYQEYFGDNGWTITNSSGVESTSEIGAIFAATSSATVNTTIITKGNGSDVTISYVAVAH